MKIEKGTGNMNDVDISWIPKETLDAMSTFYTLTRSKRNQQHSAGIDLLKATASFLPNHLCYRQSIPEDITTETNQEGSWDRSIDSRRHSLP